MLRKLNADGWWGELGISGRSLLELTVDAMLCRLALAAASTSYTCSRARVVIAALLGDLIPTPQSSVGPGAGTRLTPHSVSVASRTKRVANRHSNEILRVSSGSLQGNLTAKKKFKN